MEHSVIIGKLNITGFKHHIKPQGCLSGGRIKGIQGPGVPRTDGIPIFWVVVGGLLIGLGAFFSARVLSNFSATRDLNLSLVEVVGHSLELTERFNPGGFHAEGVGGMWHALRAQQVVASQFHPRCFSSSETCEACEKVGSQSWLFCHHHYQTG